MPNVYYLWGQIHSALRLHEKIAFVFKKINSEN